MSSSKLETLCRRQSCQQGLLEYHIQLEDARLRTPVRRLQGWKWKCCNSTATSTHSDKPKQTSRIVKSCRQNKQKDSLLSFTQTQQCNNTTLTLSASGLSFRRGKIMLRLLSDPRICALSKPPRMNYEHIQNLSFQLHATIQLSYLSFSSSLDLWKSHTDLSTQKSAAVRERS